MTRNKRDWIQAPARTIGTTRRSVSGYFMWNGSSIPYESSLERDFLIRTTFSSSVLDVISQPVQLKYTADSGREYPYTPDYLVYYRTDKDAEWGTGRPPMLVEVKPREEIRAKWPSMKPKFKEARRFAREQGYVFAIFDESRIRDQKLTNISFLQRYKRMAFPEEQTNWILENLRNMGQAPFDHLLARHFFGKADKAIGVSHLWHMLATGLIECDMMQPLSNQTILWVPSNE
ncbi:MAG: heteromeric transposase endonuclease subunit TnsA [Gammaproteobacteria bacterium]|nr:MAG: heteromeric transposase endonuclease subunit TnsA [Gammaproteobacteria bacterium]